MSVDLYTVDARSLVWDYPDATCLVIDPPYDRRDLVEWAATLRRPASTLVFTDPRNLAASLEAFGPSPTWLFVWDTASSWSTGARFPLTSSKLCLWYGSHDHYDQDRHGAHIGPPPPARNHPTTVQEPGAGRRLVDVHRQSLRWLHNPTAGRKAGTVEAGSPRAREAQRPDAVKHAKPLDWVRAMIAATSPHGRILDPFLGSGTSLRAALELGRPITASEIDEATMAWAQGQAHLEEQTEDALRLF